MILKQGQIFLQWTIVDESELEQVEEIVLNNFQELLPDRPCTIQAGIKEVEL